jgi:hypothetical protein
MTAVSPGHFPNVVDRVPAAVVVRPVLRRSGKAIAEGDEDSLLELVPPVDREVNIPTVSFPAAIGS